MADYHTKTATIGEVTVTASKAKSGSAADRLEAVLIWIGEAIENGIPAIDNTLPGGVPPVVDNTLPPEVDNTLPPPPTTPDNTLPGAQPGIDNTLPLQGLADFLTKHAKEIAAAVLKGTLCDPAQPKG